MIPTALAPTVSKYIQQRLKDFDPNLKAIFNCQTERFEILRFSKGRYHWVIAVENEDESFRPLDERIFKRLHKMDVIARWGSVANYEKHLDEKLKNWKDGKDKEMNHELRSDIKDDWKLWQGAAENLRSGIINSPPEERERKIYSYSKGG